MTNTFTCDYCNRTLDVETYYYTQCGTGMEECVCCAKECSCHKRCNCHINTDECPECAISQYAQKHGGVAKILVCSCEFADKKRGQYGVEFDDHTVCIECTPMNLTR